MVGRAANQVKLHCATARARTTHRALRPRRGRARLGARRAGRLTAASWL